jgi:pectinesterase
MLVRSIVLTALSLSLPLAHGAERMTVTVTHALAQPRAAETISVPWADVNRILPGALLQHIAVKDAAGRVLPYQVTNVNPEAKDPQGKGIAYGELIFQHDFAAGEQAATFTVEKIEAMAPVFASKVFARYVPERLDDFAWENDRIGHRAYGPALAAPAAAGSGKEVLVASGIDIWFKRVDYLVVDRWYNKGHDHYHKDEGEGIDMYNVGATRGAGGTGVWDGKTLFTSRNYTAWKVLANGPVRAIFELSYDAWDAGGVKVSEVKRFTVDAGHNFDQVDSTFTFAGAGELTIAVGLNKAPSDKNQEAVVGVIANRADSSLVQWVTQRRNGAFGTALIVPSAAEPAYAADARNELMLAKVRSGQPLRYFVGAGWTGSGQFASQQDWQSYVAAAAARARSPIKVEVSGAP